MTSEKVVGALLGWPLCGEGPNSDRRTERVLLELGVGGGEGRQGTEPAKSHRRRDLPSRGVARPQCDALGSRRRLEEQETSRGSPSPTSGDSEGGSEAGGERGTPRNVGSICSVLRGRKKAKPNERVVWMNVSRAEATPGPICLNKLRGKYSAAGGAGPGASLCQRETVGNVRLYVFPLHFQGERGASCPEPQKREEGFVCRFRAGLKPTTDLAGWSDSAFSVEKRPGGWSSA